MLHPCSFITVPLSLGAALASVWLIQALEAFWGVFCVMPKSHGPLTFPLSTHWQMKIFVCNENRFQHPVVLLFTLAALRAFWHCSCRNVYVLDTIFICAKFDFLHTLYRNSFRIFSMGWIWFKLSSWKPRIYGLWNKVTSWKEPQSLSHSHLLSSKSQFLNCWVQWHYISLAIRTARYLNLGFCTYPH